MEEMFYLHPPDNDASLPKKVYVEPTSLCNLNCSICFRHGWFDEPKGHMCQATFDSLVCHLASTDSVEEVFFGGMGEPLFHPDIVQMLSRVPSGIKKSLLTNGSLLTPQISRTLVENGLDELWISMDGFTKDSHDSIQLGSCFESIISNISDFNKARKDAKTKLCITFVVTPDNLSQLEEINSFADAFNVDLLNISHMIPGAPVKENEMLYNRQDIYVGKMHRYAETLEKHEENLCPFVSTNSVFVRWDGNVIPCMQLLHNTYTYLYEQRRKITSFSYGNITEMSLLSCWNNPEYKVFRHRVNTFYFPFCTVCWGCEDREENKSDCFLGEAPTCGACLWSTGKVFCP